MSLLAVAPLSGFSRVRHMDSETIRIRAHFDSVLTELRGRSIEALTQQQRAARAALVAEVERYRDRGVFPHNYDFAEPTPYFVDRKTGTLCAVANLLAFSGRRDIVDRVARTTNNVYVRDLAHDTAFVGWLGAHGLTLDEAARIQVAYVGSLTPAQQERQASFAMMAPFAVTGVATSIWNLSSNADGHRTALSWTGAIAGAGSLLAGTALLLESPTPKATAIGSAGIIAGAVSAGIAMRTINLHHEIELARRSHQKRVEASIAPTVTAQGGAGLVIALRY